MESANWFLRLYGTLLYVLLLASTNGASPLVGKVDNELVDAIRQVRNYKEKDKCMALFDFSGSLAYGSLDSAILYYQIDQMKFGFTPTEFREAFYFSPEHTKMCISTNHFAFDQNGVAIPTKNLFRALQMDYAFLYEQMYGDKKKSLREVKNDAKYERFKLLMLYYHQQFDRKVQNEKACASLKKYQTSRWWMHLSMHSVKEILFKVARYEAGEIKQVVGTVTIEGQSARVQYTFDFKINTEALDLIKVLNAENIHTVIMTEAEKTMMSYYNDQVIHAKSVYGTQYTEYDPRFPSQTSSIPSAAYHLTSSQTVTPEMSSPTFLGYVKPGTINPVAYGKDEIIKQIMEMRGSKPCIVFADSASDYSLVRYMTRGVIVVQTSRNSGNGELYEQVMSDHTEVKDHHVRVFKQRVDGSRNWVSSAIHAYEARGSTSLDWQ
ncbi:unnamed protein product [Albugo candida]|uniref:Uncharacterized protein n=1 Tax=Albugo candida TaxID=65357 RepID=A0A024FWB9_9STRA|nr:unnamed protein product [Albugo candida]|eukprot:CCI11336.1 unnamed protein product [Albugo candida]